MIYCCSDKSNPCLVEIGLIYNYLGTNLLVELVIATNSVAYKAGTIPCLPVHSGVHYGNRGCGVFKGGIQN